MTELRAYMHACLGFVARVGGREDDGVVAHREAVRLVGAAEDLVQRLLMWRRGLAVPAVVVVVPEHAFPEADRGRDGGWDDDGPADGPMIRGWMDGFLSVIGLAHWLGFYSALGGPLRGLHRRLLTLSAADQLTLSPASLSLSLPISSSPLSRPAGHQRLCMHATHVCSISQSAQPTYPRCPCTFNVPASSYRLRRRRRRSAGSDSEPPVCSQQPPTTRVTLFGLVAVAGVAPPVGGTRTLVWCQGCVRAAVRSSDPDPVPTARRHQTISSMLRK